MGYMSQKFSLYPEMTVSKTWSSIPACNAYGSDKRNAEDAGACGLGGRETNMPRLSGVGRGSHGIAIMHRPKILFLEPTKEGPESVGSSDIIYDLAADGTTVMVTHFMTKEHRDRSPLYTSAASSQTISGKSEKLIPGRLYEIGSDNAFDCLRRSLREQG